jgi:hypothetical protein
LASAFWTISVNNPRALPWAFMPHRRGAGNKHTFSGFQLDRKR